MMNSILKFSKTFVIAIVAMGLVTSCNNDDDNPTPKKPTSIAAYVQTSDNLTSLAAAMDATGLTATLDGDEDYTLFAPTDAAFDAFLEENGYTELSEVPTSLLKQILLNHLQPGKIKAADFTTGYLKSMANGSASDKKLSLYINADDGVVLNGEAKVTKADAEAGNGVVHIVDNVIPLPNLITFASADPDFSSLVDALMADDSFIFLQTLQTTEGPNVPFTLLAPTNEAFSSFLSEKDYGSLDDVPTDLLQSILSYHVVAGQNLRTSDLSDGMTVQTLQGADFTVNVTDNSVGFKDAVDRTGNVVTKNIQATNGVIQAIDNVLLPPM